MLNVINKKCYQKDGNSVCVIKFNLSDDDKIYDSIHYGVYTNCVHKFYKKYKVLADGWNGIPQLTTFTVVGKSKCSPDDKFDAEKGMELAIQRAYKKVNAYNMQFTGMLENEISDILAVVNGKFHCAERQWKENFNKVEELSK